MGARVLASASMVALLATPCVSMAQSTGHQQLEEIVVTATRRSERLQDVPLSITAFSPEDLQTKGIVGYEGLARETPGVVLNRATANFNNFTARGIATNGYGANLQNTVAIYLDELPISTIGNTTVLDPNLYDVERIEFLRGPQGTLFGSGSLSGAMRILTNSPDLTSFDASASIDYGVTSGDSLRQRYNAMVNVPLVDEKLALRVVGFYRDEEGYLDNLGTGKRNSNTLIDYGGRALLLWQPIEPLSVRLMFSHEDSTPEDSSLTAPALGRNKRVSDRPDLFVGNLTTSNATIEYRFEGATLTSSSTYSEFDQKFFVDLAGTFGGGIAFALDAYGYQDTFVEEMRLASDTDGKFDWVIGGFYLDRRHDVDYNYRSSPAFLAARGITGLPDEYYQRQHNHFLSHEIAGFGELTYRFTDRFWLTGGARYGNLDAQAYIEGGYTSAYLLYAITGASGPLAMVPIAPAVGVKAKGSRTSYKLSASFQPMPSLTTYVTASTGFPRAGRERFRRTPQRRRSQRPRDSGGRGLGQAQELRDRCERHVVRWAVDQQPCGLRHRLERHPGAGEPRLGLGAIRYQHRRRTQQGFRVRVHRGAGCRPVARSHRLVQRCACYGADGERSSHLGRVAGRAARGAEVPGRGVRAIRLRPVGEQPRLFHRQLPARRFVSEPVPARAGPAGADQPDVRLHGQLREPEHLARRNVRLAGCDGLRREPARRRLDHVHPPGGLP